MARIPRNERFVDFQPSAPVLTPLSLGDTSAFANALASGAKTVGELESNRRKGEDAAALNRLNQNLADEIQSSELDLNKGPTSDDGTTQLPYTKFREHAEGQFEENLAGHLEDPALLNLLPANQRAMETAIFKARGTLGRNAELISARVLNAELQQVELERETVVQDNIGASPDLSVALEEAEDYYDGLIARSVDDPSLTPVIAQNRKTIGMKKVKAAAFSRLTSELSNSLLGLSEGTSHPDIDTMPEAIKAIKDGDFDEIVDFSAGGRDALINKLYDDVNTTQLSVERAVSKKARLDGYALLDELATKALDPNAVIRPEDVQAVAKQLFQDKNLSPDAAVAVTRYLKGLVTDPTKPNAAESLAFNRAKNDIAKFVLEASLRDQPVNRETIADQIAGMGRLGPAGKPMGIPLSSMHPSHQAEFLLYVSTIVKPANQDLASATTWVQGEVAKVLRAKPFKDTSIEGKILSILTSPGSADFPELDGDLAGRLFTPIENFVRRWSKENPGKKIDRTFILENVLKDISKGKVGDPTVIDIDEDTLYNAIYKQKLGIHELSPEERYIVDLADIKATRTASIHARYKEASAAATTDAERDKLDAKFGKILEPSGFTQLSVAIRANADAAEMRARVEAYKNKTPLPSVPVPPKSLHKRREIVKSPNVSPREVPPAPSPVPSPAVPIEPHEPQAIETQAIKKPVASRREVPPAPSSAVPIPRSSKMVEPQAIEKSVASPREVPSVPSPAVPIRKSLRKMKEMVKSMKPNVFPRTPPRMSEEQVRESKQYKEEIQALDEEFELWLENTEITADIVATDFKERFPDSPAIIAVVDRHLAEMAKAKESYDWEAYSDALQELIEFFEQYDEDFHD